MGSLLEITGDDIAQLDDAALRELIGLLCEADYRLGGLSTKGITWGGHQDAADGGLDVVVRCEDDPPKASFIPRKTTGFQVKKPDMSKVKIIAEMQPKGHLRDEIKALIQDSGAYIIVNSSGSTTDKSLQNRISAMREATVKEDGSDQFVVDFFDRNRIATWVRSHSAMILWVRNKIGRNLQGWHPYDNWAKAPGGIEEEYLLDDNLRLRDEAQTQRSEVSVQQGMLVLRSTLSVSKTSVRLAGLSGVGKTRLVQALFDERVGLQALNPSLAFYADISHNPEPSPQVFAEQLITGKTKAILIVDNCPPDLHRHLTEICSQQHSKVSLLTIEYDIREDIPNETNVFRLEPASEELIEKLIKKRYPHISQVDAHTIAHFSGGNARMAIALANTVKRNESLSAFHDEELFKRLFWQRESSDNNLLASAEVCSLVYSFEGTDTKSKEAELSFLASLIDKTALELYKDVNTLKERDLVQSRSVWRAVLPHAVANRLAKRALNSIPPNTIQQAFLYSSSERLIKSFSKRLGYLHDSDAAKEIVGNWLSPDGWLGKANCNFNDLGMNVFENIAPVSPENTLQSIERAANGETKAHFVSKNNIHYSKFVDILWHLAYDAKLFTRSVEILIRFALLEDVNQSNSSTLNSLRSLFSIILSGTHAPAETRVIIITELTNSKEKERQALGMELLSRSLKAWDFSSFHDFSFGARPRDFGLYPRTRIEIEHWFNTFINICTSLALSDDEIIALKARKLLSEKMRGLWTGGGMYETLEKSAQKIHEQKAWNDGWRSVREILQLDSKSLNEESLETLYRLEKSLKPANLLEHARVFALSDRFDHIDLGDDFEKEDETSSWEQADKITRELGFQVAQDSDTLYLMLPEIVSTYASRLYTFGQGLADGSDDKQETWNVLFNQFKKTEPEKQQFVVLVGYLSACAESVPEFYNSTLDSLVNDEYLGKWFPSFQGDVKIDQRGIERLHESLGTGHAKVETFRNLAWGRRHEAIGDDDLAELLTKLQKQDNGIGVALDILRMRFHETEEKQIQHSEKLIELACSLLLEYPFPKGNLGDSNTHYALAQLTKVCFSSKFGVEYILSICEHFAELIATHRVYSFEYAELFSAIARIKPFMFLDVFLENKSNIENYSSRLVFRDSFDEHNPFINQIAVEDLISWCEITPETRYLLLASATKLFSRSKEKKEMAINPIAYVLFDKAPNLTIVLQYLSKSIISTSWSGSLADILSEGAKLLKELFEHENEEIKSWANEQYSIMQNEANEARENEEKHNRLYNERFE